MRAWYTDHLGFTASLCLMTNGHSTRVTVKDPEGHCIHIDYYPTWNTAVNTLRFMLPGAINDLTHKPI